MWKLSRNKSGNLQNNFKVILVSKQPPKVNFGISKLIFECSNSLFWTLMSMICCLTAYCWTSMSISGDPTSYYWTSRSILICRNSWRGAAAMHGDYGGSDGGGVQRTGHLAGPQSMVPRNQISHSGNPSLRFSSWARWTRAPARCQSCWDAAAVAVPPPAPRRPRPPARNFYNSIMDIEVHDMRWDGQIWTLRSNNNNYRLWDRQKWTLRSKLSC